MHLVNLWTGFARGLNGVWTALAKFKFFSKFFNNFKKRRKSIQIEKFKNVKKVPQNKYVRHDKKIRFYLSEWNLCQEWDWLYGFNTKLEKGHELTLQHTLSTFPLNKLFYQTPAGSQTLISKHSKRPTFTPSNLALIKLLHESGFQVNCSLWLILFDLSFEGKHFAL